MRQGGQITVFLSMCLLCTAALLCVMLECARTAGSKFYFQVAVESGLDTLFSRYHRRLWEEYRILALEYDTQEELEKNLETYVNRYLETDSWYPMRLESMEVTRLSGLGDEQGAFLAEEVLDYMKYGLVSQFIFAPEDGEQFLKDVTEAAGAGTLTEMYSDQEKEVRKLEQAAEKLLMNIREQERYAAETGRALYEDDEYGFYKAADNYRRSVAGYPGLMKKYRKQAEALAGKQQRSRAEIESIGPDLQEDRKELFESQWNPYDAYIREDGERYREFAAWEQGLGRNLQLLEQTGQLVEELIEEYEEDDDDEDEGEELSLAPAAELWQQRENSGINTDSGSGDKEKQNLLDRIRSMAGSGLLGLVMPEGTVISSTAFSTADLPSGTAEAGQGDQRQGNGLVDRVIIGEYCGRFFSHALDDGERQVRYEFEYVLEGENRDRGNLEKVVAELFAVREGLNLIHILSDSAKREEARALALVITGSIGLAPLAEITACLIMGIWAMGEAIADLRTLMAGGSVPLWKSGGEWRLSLEGLLDMGRQKLPSADSRDSLGRGLTYEGYLKLLLLKEKPEVKHMRMLDLMQLNIRQKEPGFLVEKCGYHVDIRGKACGKHVFFALPFVKSYVGEQEGYMLEAGAGKAY